MYPDSWLIGEHLICFCSAILEGLISYNKVYRIVSETKILFKTGSQFYAKLVCMSCMYVFVLSNFAAFIGQYFLYGLNRPENCTNDM